jgi:hypothetical protein
VIPFAEVISIEKRTTAFVIPNAIQVATMHARHSFASFLSRDTTYELLVNIWHISHPTIPAVALPDHEADESEEAIDEDEIGEEGAPRKRINLASRHKASNGKRDRLNPQATVETIGHSHAPSPEPGPARRKATHKATSIPPTIKQYKDTCLNDVFTSSPEKIYNLMFTSQAFMKDFWANNQKLTGAPAFSTDSHLTCCSRNRSARLGAVGRLAEADSNLFLHQATQRSCWSKANEVLHHRSERIRRF